jgi:hypothetical protein
MCAWLLRLNREVCARSGCGYFLEFAGGYVEDKSPDLVLDTGEDLLRVIQSA